MSLDNNHYYLRLNKVLIAVFWMYVVYSMNYWGLSVYYWYFFGGLVIAFGRIIDKAVESEALNNKLDNDRTIKAGV
jgi:Cu/Ag efflux pump CusA